MDITNKEVEKLQEYYNNIYENTVSWYLEKMDFDMYEYLEEKEEKEMVAVDKVLNEPFSDDLTEEEEKIVENLLKGLEYE